MILNIRFFITWKVQKTRCTVCVILKDESFGVHLHSTFFKENYSCAHKSTTTRRCVCNIHMHYATPQFFFFSLLLTYRCVTEVLSAISVSPGLIQVLANLQFVMLHYVTDQNAFVCPKWFLVQNLYACVRRCNNLTPLLLVTNLQICHWRQQHSRCFSNNMSSCVLILEGF